MKKIKKITRKRLAVVIIVECVLGLMVLGAFHLWPLGKGAQTARTKEQNLQQAQQSKQLPTKLKIDVPLESQFSDPALDNGCEVTALSMLLNYYGYPTDKNSLAERVNYVPLFLDDELRGNPHDGFVGEIAEGDLAMGMEVEPTAEVAKQIVGNEYQVMVSQRDSLTEVLKVVAKKIPVWVKVTQEFVVPTADDFMYWDTTSGQVKVTPLNHAAVITGFDQGIIFVNDPYGYKDREVPIAEFENIFDQLGRQSLYLVPKKKTRGE